MKEIAISSKTWSSPATSPDQWVANRLATPTEPTKRLTVDIPLSLHKRVKTQCVVDGLVMADVVRELLDKRFPAASSEERHPALANAVSS